LTNGNASLTRLLGLIRIPDLNAARCRLRVSEWWQEATSGGIRGNDPESISRLISRRGAP
jgi:hypothetical protein